MIFDKFSGILFILLIAFNKFPPTTFSITRQKCSFVSNNSNSLTILLCFLNLIIILTSFLILFIEKAFFFLLNDLIETICPLKTCRAILTFPKAPCPILLPIL